MWRRANDYDELHQKPPRQTATAQALWGGYSRRQKLVINKLIGNLAVGDREGKQYRAVIPVTLHVVKLCPL